MLRPYPNLGKFEGLPLVALVAYEITLVGSDDWVDVGDGSSWALIDGSINTRGAFTDVSATLLNNEFDGALTADEERWCHDAAGFIVSEDGRGFVHVERFEGERDLRKAWCDIEASVLNCSVE